MRFPSVSLLVVLLIPGLLACSGSGKSWRVGSSVVAVMGETEISMDEYAKYVRKAARQDPKKVSPQVASALLDQYVEELLIERAVSDAASELSGTSIEEKRRQLLSVRARIGEITQAELQAEYEKKKDVYQKPELVKLSQLLFTVKEKAELARKKLEKGASWLEVSREMSEAPNKLSGGSLGFLARRDVPREFEAVIWRQPPGSRTPILTAPYGFHIFLVEERIEGRTVSLEEALPALRLAVAQRRSEEALASLLLEMRKRYPVRVVEDHLPFPYVGTLPKVLSQPG